MANDEENVGNTKKQLAKLFEASLRVAFPNELDVEPLVAACTAKFGDYQWYFFRVFLHYLAFPQKQIQEMLLNGIGTWAPRLQLKRAVVDFSSPNIAKEMHVGNLRYTIIGDTLARMLEFSNVEVLRRNHVGDWGTQFGMLIEFLFEKFPNWEDAKETAIGDLQAFYKASNRRFDSDAAFKEKARQAVVRLQGGEESYRRAWSHMCEISRREFDSVYQRLQVQLEEKAAKRAGWLTANDKEYPKTSHVGFGLVLGDDGKRFRTRNTEVVRLVDLLDEAKSRSKDTLEKRGKAAEWTVEELEQTAEAVGYRAVKREIWCWIILMNVFWGFICSNLLRVLGRRRKQVGYCYVKQQLWS